MLGEEMDEEDDGVNNFVERAYQSILAEQAYANNKILFLPTGSGKTFIAIMVLKRMLPLLELPLSIGGKRVMFLVNTVALVEQQAQVLERHLLIPKVGRYSGDMNVDFWNMGKWQEEFETFKVMVMTAEILNQLLLKKYISLSNIALLILDECHHAVEDHPMRQIMKLFVDCPKQDQPRVIGLTATLLNGTPKSIPKVTDEVKKLEITLHSTVATVNSWDIVKQFSTKPRETFAVFQSCSNTHVNQCISEKINSAYLMCKSFNFVTENNSVNTPRFLDGFVSFNTGKKFDLANLVLQVSKQAEWLGMYGCLKTIQAVYVSLRLAQQKMMDKNSHLMIHSLYCLLFSLGHYLEGAMGRYKLEENKKAYNYSSPKVQKLVELLKNFNDKCNSQPEDKREPMQALIFVQEKMTAKVLCSVLKNISQNSVSYGFIKTGFIVGGSANPISETWEGAYSKHINDGVMERFRDKLINVLVATDVLEEGIDIPDCNMVVRFDLALGVRSYIQSKGRARHSTSLFYLMVSNKEHSVYQNRIMHFCAIEKALEEHLVGHTDERLSPSELEYEALYESAVEPYYTPIGSKVTLTSSIQLVNGYCMFLAHDRFSKVSPTWRMKKKEKVTVAVQLPRLSPFQDQVKGEPMFNLRLAKRSAALEMCKRLHETGELNDYLMPNEKCLAKEDMQLLLPLWENEDQEQSEPKTGTTKRTRLYDIFRPQCCLDCAPTSEGLMYLHHLEIYPAYEKPSDGRKSMIYTVLNEKKNFAIISSKPLDKVCEFPIFSKFGSISVKVRSNFRCISLSEEEIMDVTLYHWRLFTSVIPMAKNYVSFSKTSYMIAPTIMDSNGDVVLDFTAIRAPEHSSPDNFLKCVVTPTHRGLASPHEAYFITRVCQELNGNSAFPNPQYLSYQDYFKKNYSITISSHLPLLEVQPFKIVSNDLIPRMKNLKGNASDVIHFPPELCKLKCSDGCLFLKATMLPSILHRLERFLIVNELRCKISSNIGALNGPHNNECTLWKQMESFISVKNCEVSMLTPTVTFAKEDHPPPKKKKTASSMPWNHLVEPVNIEHNFENVSLSDIDSYAKFISKKVSSGKLSMRLQNQNASEHWKLPPNKAGEGAIKLLTDSTVGPHPCHILEALTTASADDFWNLERLETLGDSFLKFAVSFILFKRFPDLHEGKLTQVKGQILGNRNLFYCAKAKNFGVYLKAIKMVPSEGWIPPSFSIPAEIFDESLAVLVRSLELSKEEQFNGILKKSSLDELKKKASAQQLLGNTAVNRAEFHQQLISDKTVADCVESLIGAYLQTSGPRAAMEFLEFMKVVPGGSKALLVNHSPVLQTPKGRYTNPFAGASDLQDRLGYRFKDVNLLTEALTHASVPSATNTYERLEFVGDAVLDFLITAYIFENCGKLSPGELTDLRSALVNNITFACLTVRYGFYKFMVHASPALMDSMDRFLRYQEKRNHEIDEEVLILLEESECRIAETLEVPKALGDIFEALIGAVFLDSGKSLPTVWGVIYRLIKKEICTFSRKVPKQVVRRLYEAVGQHNLKFRVSDAPKEMCMEQVQVVLAVSLKGENRFFNGFGVNKNQAKKSAAKLALRHLKFE